MAKNARKPPANHGKPITAFFTRSSKAPPATQAAPSSSATISSEQVPKSESTQNEVPVVDGSALSSLRKSARTGNSQTPLHPSALASSLKRSRSPDPRLSAVPSTPKRISQSIKSPGRRKGKFDTDSETETNNDVVFVKYTPNPQIRKKARLSSPSEVPSLPNTDDVVPSSQSDEEELATKEAISNVQVKVSNEKHTQPSPPELEATNGLPMSIDEDTIARPGSTFSSSTGNMLIQQDDETLNPIFTPLSCGLASMPPTPVALDAAGKTAKIIADIKARAYAKSLSSPESTPLEFNEQLDDSSDEDDFLPVRPMASKKDPSPKLNASAAPVQRSFRYSLRNRSPSSPTRNQASTSQITSGKASSIGSNSAKQHGKKPLTVDPFDVLLKEKRSAEKRGTGNDAFRLAEIITKKFNIDGDSVLNDADLEEGEDSMDWRAATQAARNSDWLVNKPLISGINRNGSPNMNLGKDDRKRLFGENGESGKAILDILEHDKAAKRQAELSEKVPGVQFWSKSSDANNHSMDVDEAISLRQLPGDSPVVHLFNASLGTHDFSYAAMLLNMDIMLAVDVSERAMVSSCLVDFALSPRPNILSEPATDSLENFWSLMSEPLSSSISFSQVLNTIHRLGGDLSILTAQNWTVPSSSVFNDVDPAHRLNIVRRLIVLINACASSARLKKEEIPDILLATLLLGMDSGASPDFLQDVTQAVDKICHCILPDLQLEYSLSSKLLDCVASYEPINKDRFVSLLSNGAGPTRRIACLVAHLIIAGKRPEQVVTSSGLPPLPEVLEQLTPYLRSTTTAPGKFALHEQTDYVDLGFYISILAVAVSDIRGYVAQERQTPKSKKQVSLKESPTKNGEKPKTDLQLLHLALETLHSNISDTRATHLERSRTKAIIKGLAMIIHYQREIWLRNDPERSKTTLAQYFKKKDKL